MPSGAIGGDFYVIGRPRALQLSPDDQAPGIIHYYSEHHTAYSIVIGDVTGHGIGSALVMTLCMGLFSDSLQVYQRPSDILNRVNQRLCQLLPESLLYYVTAGVMTYYPQSQQVYYSQAGHPPALLIRDNACVSLTASNSFMGLYTAIEFTELSITLTPLALAST